MVVPPRHYTVESLSQKLEVIFTQEKAKIEITINTPVGQMAIHNYGNQKVVLGRDLAWLLGIGRKLSVITFVKRFTYQAPTLFTVTWLTKSKTCSTENPQVSWLDLTSKVGHSRKFTTKRCFARHIDRQIRK